MPIFLRGLSIWSRFTILLAVCFLFYSCSLVGQSCEDCSDELKKNYNNYIDKTTPLSEAEILTKCQAAKKKCPDLSIAYELEGLLHWENNRMDEALANYLKAVMLSPGDENVLADARSVAIAKDLYLFGGETGIVVPGPFSGITLEQYLEYPKELRTQWCERAMENYRSSYRKSSKYKLKFEIETPHDLDRNLLAEANKNSKQILGIAALGYSLPGAVIIR